MKSLLRSLMNTPLSVVLRVCGVNLIVFLTLLLAAELAVRVILSEEDPRTSQHKYWLRFRPYVMFGMDHDLNDTFAIHKSYEPHHRSPGTISATIKTNNVGFRHTENFFIDKIRPKKKGERVVLFSGGSAAFGVGATSNEKTISYQIEAELNKKQDRFAYTVFSISSGGWIAFEEFIALNLWGLNLQPDWIVTMDGNNDIVAACSTDSSGFFHNRIMKTLKDYSDSYLYQQSNPPFYRGWLENQIIKYSAFYRKLTNQKFIPSPPVKKKYYWPEIDKVIQFYIHSV